VLSISALVVTAPRRHGGLVMASMSDFSRSTGERAAMELIQLLLRAENTRRTVYGRQVYDSGINMAFGRRLR
jgi:hypothetical protein